MHKIIFRIVAFSLLVAFSSCNSKQDTSIPHTIHRSFYHWKQNFHIEKTGFSAIEDLKLQTMYVRFFDIIWQPPTGAIPTAIVNFESKVPDSLMLIPCIYIENKVFLQLKEKSEVDTLAEKSATKIKSLLQKSGKTVIKEIQLDCDWTSSTKQAYFHFLSQFKKHFDKNILFSATIRLHQIKYAQKTGVPPVDKGMLMYYNMGKIKEPSTRNSILDNSIGRQYISSKTSYDLPLDIALPIFEWGVWFQRDKFAGIFNDLNEAKLKEMGDFKELKKGVYMLEKDTVAGNRYVRRGDVIRLEGIEAETLKEAADICRQAVNSQNLNVAFYHWETDLIDQQGIELLEEVYEQLK